jgi:hypothetical protein
MKKLILILIAFLATTTTNAMSNYMQKDTVHFVRDSINYEAGSEIKKFVNNIVAGGLLESIGAITLLVNTNGKSDDNYGQTAGFIIILVGAVITLSALAHLFKAGQIMQMLGTRRKKKKK